jgi:hypothetical protein
MQQMLASPFAQPQAATGATCVPSALRYCIPSQGQLHTISVGSGLLERGPGLRVCPASRSTDRGQRRAADLSKAREQLEDIRYLGLPVGHKHAQGP